MIKDFFFSFEFYLFCRDLEDNIIFTLVTTCDLLLRYKASSAIKQEQHTFALNSFDKVLSSLLEQLALKVPDALSGNLRLTSSAEAGKCYSQLSSRTPIDALLIIR